MRKILFLMSIWLPLLAMGADVTTDKFYINDFTIAPGEQKEIELNLLSTQDYFSLQVSVYLPEGLSFVEDEIEGYAIPSDRIPFSRRDPWGYNADFVEGGDGSLLITAYSPNLINPLQADDGVVFTLIVKADENLVNDGVIYCKNSELTNTEYNNFNGPDTECNVKVCRTASLPQVVAGGIEQARYKISNNLTCVYVSSDLKTLYAKDNNGFAMQDQEPYVPSEEQISNETVYDAPETFDQSNWVAINLPEALTVNQASEYKGHTISNIVGVLKNKLNPEIDADEKPVLIDDVTDAYTIPNLYTIASFAAGNTWFVMPPKPQEYVKIHWAVYKDRAFYMPKQEGNINGHGLTGAVAANLSMYDGTDFENNNVYELTAIVKALKPRVATTTTGLLSTNIQESEISEYYELYPITSSQNDQPTDISVIGVDRQDGIYYNLLGQPVSNPTPGIYIRNGKKVIVK